MYFVPATIWESASFMPVFKQSVGITNFGIGFDEGGVAEGVGATFVAPPHPVRSSSAAREKLIFFSDTMNLVLRGLCDRTNSHGIYIEVIWEHDAPSDRFCYIIGC